MLLSYTHPLPIFSIHSLFFPCLIVALLGSGIPPAPLPSSAVISNSSATSHDDGNLFRLTDSLQTRNGRCLHRFLWWRILQRQPAVLLKLPELRHCLRHRSQLLGMGQLERMTRLLSYNARVRTFYLREELVGKLLLVSVLPTAARGLLYSVDLQEASFSWAEASYRPTHFVCHNVSCQPMPGSGELDEVAEVTGADVTDESSLPRRRVHSVAPASWQRGKVNAQLSGIPMATPEPSPLPSASSMLSTREAWLSQLTGWWRHIRRLSCGNLAALTLALCSLALLPLCAALMLMGYRLRRYRSEARHRSKSVLAARHHQRLSPASSSSLVLGHGLSLTVPTVKRPQPLDATGTPAHNGEADGPIERRRRHILLANASLPKKISVGRVPVAMMELPKMV